MVCSHTERPGLTQARKEAKRQEELRLREAELLQARKAYFEERKQVRGQDFDIRPDVRNKSVARVRSVTV